MFMMVYKACIFAALLPLVAGLNTLSKRQQFDPVLHYLTQMCYPLYSNFTREMVLISQQVPREQMRATLINSPFPCDQALYMDAVCKANGTEEVDFLAEQQCLCGGSYFEVLKGCVDCYLGHGYQEELPGGGDHYSSMTSLSLALCTPSPPIQPFSNYFPPVTVNATVQLPLATLGVDKWPNNTATSNYFTATGSITTGEITGSATARLTTWTNTGSVRYTPTASTYSTGVSETPSHSPTPIETVNVGVKEGAGLLGGILAVGLGAVALL